MMKNREIYVKDPDQYALLNNGFATVKDTETAEELKTLRYELETFVCEGQYAKGLARILDTYLHNLDRPEQPAVWVSGFFGSGKSHLIKMLRAFWTDYRFPEDHATARGLARLPEDIAALLRELSTVGKRLGGLHAAAGTLGAGVGDNVRLSLLAIIFRSAGLPEEYPLARFVLWLHDNGHLTQVKAAVEKTGRSWDKELRNMYVSPVLANALLQVIPGFASSPAEVRAILKTQYPNVNDVTSTEMVEAIQDTLSRDGKFPCALIALDEVQQYIGENSNRTYLIQEVTEACTKKFGGQLLFASTGQTALSGTPQLQKLKDRFRVSIELSDTDVDTVIRKIVLAKKPDRTPAVAQVLTANSGEISRHLVGTRIEPRTEDQQYLAADYPLLPVRRRFWERALRAVDAAGTSGQLRTQLKIVHEATRSTVDAPLGTVVAGDFMFDQIAADLLQTGVLPREIYEVITKQRSGSADGDLRARLCALIFLIGKLPREAGADLGLRAIPEALADLLVEDLTVGSAELRKRIPGLLQDLVEAGHLMQIGEEYRLQTRESSAWEGDFRERLAKIINDPQRIANDRADLFRRECSRELGTIKLLQGVSKVPRSVVLHFGGESPAKSEQSIPVWIRDGWNEDEKTIVADARMAGDDDPTVFVFLPRRSADELTRTIASYMAAEETLQARGVPATPEGHEARVAMETRRNDAGARRQTLMDEILGGVRVLQAGGHDVAGVTMREMIQTAAERSLVRLFPDFSPADNPHWDKVVERAKKGSGTALEVVGHKGDPETHPVCAALTKFIAGGKKGSDIRKHFEASRYGWPRDAIDGSLYALLVSGHLRASLNGRPIEAGQIDRAKIGAIDFRVEATTVTTGQRIAVRKLLQDAGIPCKPSEELSAIPAFLQEMKQRAQAAGGDVPLPARPGTAHLEELLHLVGNDQLVAIYEQRERLATEAATWQKITDEIARRMPRWKMLRQLLSCCGDAPAAVEARTQAEAIATQCSLLDDPDPVPGLCDQLTQILREALVKNHGDYAAIYDAQMGTLQASAAWAKLSSEQQKSILAENELTAIPQIKVGTGVEVLASLDAISLDGWKTRIDALPQRFAKAQLAAAKLLEPKAVHLTLPPATLRTEDDMEAWLAETRQKIMEQLKKGPVVI